MSFELELRKILEEVVVPLKEEIEQLRQQLNTQEFPPVLTVEEAAKIMKVGKAAIYELAHHPGFPVIREGRKIRIPSQGFFEWMNRMSESSQSA